MDMNEDVDKRELKNNKAKEVMDLLEIPTIPVNAPNWYEIYAMDLYDIFMDEEKLKVLVSKLRNKAFW
jgi:hypothetical protein